MSSTAVLAVRIISDATNAAKGIDSVSKKSSVMGKAGKAAGRALALGVGAAAFAAVKATKAAADDAAAQKRLADISRNAAGATTAQVKQQERWITAQGKAKGVADDELRPALGRLIAVTHNVGKSQRLAALAMDISAGTGKSLESVSTALAKAQAGSTGGLSRLGVATKTQSGATKSLTAITKDLAKTYGGAAAKQAQTAAGKQKILSVQMGELQEKIGGGLLPVMSKLVTIGLKVVGWISRNTTLALSLVGALAAVLAIVKAVSVATQVYEAALKIWSAVTKVAAGVQWALNAAMSANPIGLVIVAIVALVAIIVIAWKKSETFRRIVIGAWNAIKKATGAVWGWIKKAISAVWKFLVTAVKTYVSTYKRVVVAVWNAIKTATSKTWNAIKGALKAVWTFIVSTVRGNINRARAIITAVWTVIRNATGRVWDGIKTAVGNAIGRVVSIVSSLRTKVTGVFSRAGQWLFDAGRRVIQGVIDGIKAMFGKVRDVLGGLTSKLTSWKGPPARDRRILRGAGESVIDGFIDGVRSRRDRVRREMSDLTRLVASTSFGDPLGRLSAVGSVAGASGVAGGRVTVIHEHTVVNGALDPVAVAKQIDDLSTRRRRRLGVRT